MILRLPYPPSNNRYYRHAKGVTYLSAEGKAYRVEVYAHCLGRKPLKGRLRVQIDAYPARGLGQDLDNLPKAILDSLQFSNVFENDNQIDDLRIIRHPKAKPAYITVRVEEM